MKTEKAYLYWARFFIRWHGRNGAMRHPKDMGKPEIESFLTMLANERQVSPATHRQAVNALLFLYKQVIGQDLTWMQSIGRPPERKRVPVVLTMEEVQAVLGLMEGVEGTLARLLFSAQFLIRCWCCWRRWSLAASGWRRQVRRGARRAWARCRRLGLELAISMIAIDPLESIQPGF